MIGATETRYSSHLFRSRLEARWAALFDLVGWDWDYEPFDGNYYIPDFALLGDGPVAVEVKPAATMQELERYADDVARGLTDHWHHDYLIVGVNVTFGKAIGWHGQYTPGYAEARDGDVHWHDAPHWNAAPTIVAPVLQPHLRVPPPEHVPIPTVRLRPRRPSVPRTGTRQPQRPMGKAHETSRWARTR